MSISKKIGLEVLLTTFYNLLSLVLKKISGLIITIFLVRIISIESFGDFMEVILSSSFAMSFSTAYLGISLIKIISKEPENTLKANELFTESLIHWFFWCVFYAVIVVCFSLNYFTVFLLPIISLEFMLESYFLARKKSNLLPKLALVKIFFVMLLVFWVKFIDDNNLIEKYIFCMFSYLIVFLLYAKYSLGLGFNYRHKLQFDYRKLILPAFISRVPVASVNYIVVTKIVAGLGSTSMAIFAVAMQSRIIIDSIAVVIGKTALPMLSNKINGDVKEYHSVLKYVILMNVVSSVIILLILLSFGSFLPHLFNMGGDELAYKTILYFCFGSVISILTSTAGSYLASSNQMWVGAALNILWSVIYISFVLYAAKSVDEIAMCWFYSYLVYLFVILIWLYRRKF
ncbi:hypothetical protein J8L86_01715 [Shewanella sp. MMG014]|uniref:hypothetical protein n=1 Tax=Shewanella sp. MMG014 TaxID=2822691 RepID=UPI001B37D84C|nr:hypothetical protein [Shewanella sp. MMG014]MBQ4888547.1 hypothetical protein [Shewanella sp. MMG014]